MFKYFVMLWVFMGTIMGMERQESICFHPNTNPARALSPKAMERKQSFIYKDMNNLVDIRRKPDEFTSPK